MISEMTSSPPGSRMPRTPAALRPIGRTSSSAKRMALPPLDAQDDVARAVGDVDADQPVAVLELDRDDAAARGRENADSDVFLTVPVRGRHEDELVLLELAGSAAPP